MMGTRRFTRHPLTGGPMLLREAAELTVDIGTRFAAVAPVNFAPGYTEGRM